MSAAGEVDRLALPRVLLGGLGGFLWQEARAEGPLNLLRTLGGSVAAKDLRFVPDRSFGQELAVRAERLGDRPFLTYNGTTTSRRELDDGAARVAQGLLERGFGQGATVGILLPNMPAFLEIVFATQRVGACAVPINTALKADGLRYILDNAGVQVLFVTAALWPQFAAIRDELAAAPLVVLVPDGAEPAAKLPRGPQTTPYAEFLAGPRQPAPDAAIPGKLPNFLMYTSGTTGYPKGVVYRYGHSQAKLARISAHLLLGRNEVYYTCLPLFHANALMITVFHSLYADATVALSRRFSAGNFWREVSESGATVFNTIGTMIAILMKTAPSPYDRQHSVQRVLSAACPAELWQPFQERFGVRLWEGFGAVDGGGFTTFNFGNAPAGSIGKPLGRRQFRLVDEAGQDVPDGTPGELIHYVGGSKNAQVAYHADRDATNDKVRDGWLHSGDLLKRDAQGYLYFVGRRTDSMRCRGENVSALEVESVVDRYADVLESAAFGVASELGEQDVMIVVQPRDGASIEPAALHAFLQERLPRYAVPRYIRVVAELPKTGTHRTIKHALKSEGVTTDTWQAPAPTRGGESASA